MTKKHNYTLNLNTVTEALMVCKLDMNVEESQFLLHYRDKFKLLEGEESALVSLEQLWEVLGSPYGGFKHWKSEVVVPLCKRLSSEISDERLPTKGRPKINSFVDTDIAKHLALLVNNEAGDVVRRYFILIEKLFKRICEYNDLRISIEQSRKDSCSNWYQSGNIFKGQEESKRYNWIMKEVIGKRNDLSTDLEEYEFVGKTVARMMRNGASDDVIFSAVSYVK
ncbi:hypothetical protein [Klebsiella aerogenes]|uniref:hypothetical protein n=1 Tax=Klebsiella aerogenes TaxID=548 RepID=UPI002D800B9B|nr:hypothetical protein [Klebsiella aerogenes]